MLNSAVPVRPKTFLDLPPEIRDLIYELVLVEAPRYQRRHTATCKWPSFGSSYEEGGYVDRSKSSPCVGPHPPKFCLCAKRRHLAILSANRQIYKEASYILWARNFFSFDTVSNFNQWFADISATKRSIIWHIAIYCVQTILFHDRVALDMDEQFLPNLIQCTGLRRLDLGPADLPEGFLETLSRQLPLSKRLRMADYVMVRSDDKPGPVPLLAWIGVAGKTTARLTAGRSTGGITPS